MVSKNKNEFQLILGSGSPRRKDLLTATGLPFSIRPADCEEVTGKSDPREVAEDLAALKGRWVLERHEGEVTPLVIASDTVVALNGKVYGKPGTREKASAMLLELAGQTHEVITAVWFGTPEKEKVFSCRSQVTFTALDEEILERYLDTGESLDKAGAYGIQGLSLSFISHLEGSYSNVVGFPLTDILRELELFVGGGEWRKRFRET